MTGKQKRILGSAVVFTVLVLLLVLIVALIPRLNERNALEEQLLEQEAEKAQLRVELQEASEAAETEEFLGEPLQERLPVVRLSDQFLQDLSMAEELSGSRIVDIDMTYDHPVYDYETIPVENPPEAREPEEDPEEQGEEELEEELEAENLPEEDGLEERQAETSPFTASGAERTGQLEGLRKQTAAVELRVNSFQSIMQFIQELENLERLANVESILFMGTFEERIIDGGTDITLEVHVSSFYYPELEELEHEAPITDYPVFPPRDNPFY